MNIYIPSRGRSAYRFLYGSSPLRWLTPALRQRTFYCVRTDEMEKYEKGLRGTGIRLLDMGLAGTVNVKRELIAKQAKQNNEPTFMMCDDDVQLYVRNSHNATGLRYPEPAEVDALFNDLERLLSHYVMVGISAREGNNRVGAGPYPLIRECTRSMRIYAFRTEDYLSIEANRLTEMQDFDTTLQLLASGRKNAVIHYWANGQHGSQTEGGCSSYRTAESHDRVCRQLCELYPGLISLRLKKNKGEQNGFGARTDVTIQWKKAFQLANHC